jgi:hypothetical protein
MKHPFHSPCVEITTAEQSRSMSASGSRPSVKAPGEPSPPFSPRALSRPERRRGDLYLFHSPKLSRTVELIGCLNMAIALRLEFDTQVVTYVERPRRLSLASGVTIEFAYWTREGKGLERFWLPVAAGDTLHHPTSSRREHRQARDLVEAAQAAHIAVEFLFEEDLRRQSATLSTWYRLLPYVQTAQTLPHRESLRQHLHALFRTQARATVEQLERELQAFQAADVRAAIFDLVHSGELVLMDSTRLGRFSVIAKRDSHEQP